jgi:hypothetical protein
MFQTITPLAAKYNLTINSKFHSSDISGVADDILKRNGTVLVVWNHRGIAPIVHALGISGTVADWDENDFDSIWIVSFNNGVAVLSKDKEGLQPPDDCK